MIKIREFDKKDTNKAIQFAITGMHFDWYLKNRFLLNLYGRYFWNLEISRATQVIAAYDEDRFVGVLLAAIEGGVREHASIGKTMYVKWFEWMQRIFFKGSADLYEETTRELLAAYRKGHAPDGEIIFLAADPEAKTRGIGSALLAELERREAGQLVFLHTDNACTYPFYEHRGFERVGEKEIVLEFGSKCVPLQCFLYAKRLGR